MNAIQICEHATVEAVYEHLPDVEWIRLFRRESIG